MCSESHFKIRHSYYTKGWMCWKLWNDKYLIELFCLVYPSPLLSCSSVHCLLSKFTASSNFHKKHSVFKLASQHFHWDLLCVCFIFYFSKSRLDDPDIFWDDSKWGSFGRQRSIKRLLTKINVWNHLWQVNSFTFPVITDKNNFQNCL